MITLLQSLSSSETPRRSFKLSKRVLEVSTPVCFLLSIVRNPGTIDHFIDLVEETNLYLEEITDELDDLSWSAACTSIDTSRFTLYMIHG